VGTSGYSDSMGSGSSPHDFVLAEGKNWKLGYDRSPSDPKGYSAIIASDSWSMAVTKSEYDDFIKVCMCSHSSPINHWPAVVSF
jgi:hypothetical protein